jgi:PAS domain S-box-containing protein
MEEEAGSGAALRGPLQEPSEVAGLDLGARVSELERQLAEERRRHSAELRAVTLRMERNLELSPLAMLEIDTRSVILRWNQSAERIFGWSAQEAVGRSFFDLFVPNLAADLVSAAWQSLLRGEASCVRNANTTKDGRVLMCQWYNTVLRDEDGAVVGVLSQAADVTEQERDQRQLRDSQALLNAVISNSPALIFAKDLEGRYILANQRACTALGLSCDELLGRTDRDFFPPQAYEQVVLRDREVLQTGRTIEFEEILELREGVRALATVKFPLSDERGAVYAVGGIATDVTERHRLTAERDEMQQQVLKAQQAALRELSTPLIPLAEGVLVMPLIGSIDTARAAQIMEVLLGGITAQGAHTALLDITGVRVVDTHVAHAILQAAQAARLLGAKVILTGLRAEVAQALVHLGAELGGLTTMSTLQSGIAHVLRR